MPAATNFEWEPIVGRTPSQPYTGPLYDHTKGKNGKGQYMFTEAGGNFAKHAMLDTPQMRMHKIRFAYSMYGATMGSLHFDVILPSGLVLTDFAPPVKGNQGIDWKVMTISLARLTARRPPAAPPPAVPPPFCLLAPRRALVSRRSIVPRLGCVFGRARTSRGGAWLRPIA